MTIDRWPTPLSPDDYAALPPPPEFAGGWLYPAFEQRLVLCSALLQVIGIETAVFCCGRQEDWEIAIRRRGNRARKRRSGPVPPAGRE